MGDMQLGNAYAAGGASDAIQEIMKSRLLQAQLGEQMRSARVQEAQHQQTIDQQAENNQMLREQQQARIDSEALARKETAAQHAASLLGPDQTIDPQTAASFQGTPLASLVQQNAPLAQPPIAGMMQPDIVPGQEPGKLRFLGTAEQRKARDDDQQAQALMNAPDLPPAMKQYLRLRTVLPKGENPPAQLFENPDKKFEEFQRQHDYSVAHPLSTPTVTIQTVDGQGNPITRIVPKSEAVGKDFAKAQPQTLIVEASHKKDALSALDQLDQAIDNAKDLVGPGAGRISNLEQMVGNADPRIQALGSKMLMAKMKVDAGIGGARAAASPQLLSRWDNLLSQKITPEGLKASVQAMREILGGSAPTKEAASTHTDPLGIR